MNMKRNSLLIAMLAIVLPLMAGTTSEEQCYYLHLDDLLDCADEEVDGFRKAFFYAIDDLDNDGVKEIVVADIFKTNCVFKAVGGKPQLISPDFKVDVEKLNWNTIFDFYTSIEADRSGDITVLHHPVMAYDIDIAHNRFTVPGDVAWDEAVMRSTKYDRMIFKPHIGNIHLVKAEPGSYTVDGTPIDLGLCYTFALDNASLTKKMFRGYKSEQATPVIVPKAWLNDHRPLQFKRWLYGEEVPSVSASVRRMITTYYGDQMRIRDISWVATCEEKERTFYDVLFEPYNGKVCLAFVCIEEGEVESTRNMWFDVSKSDPNMIDIGADIDDLMGLTPEIQVMADTPKGLELYVRWYSFEGSHFDIWREVSDQFVTVVGDYHYIMAY